MSTCPAASWELGSKMLPRRLHAIVSNSESMKPPTTGGNVKTDYAAFAFRSHTAATFFIKLSYHPIICGVVSVVFHSMHSYIVSQAFETDVRDIWPLRITPETCTDHSFEIE
jgi:hypothetical protein